MKRDAISPDTPTPIHEIAQINNESAAPFKEFDYPEKQLPTDVVAAQDELPVQDQQQLFSVQTLEKNVSECLKILDDTVMHSYVMRLSELPIVVPYFDEEKMRKEP